METKPPQLSVIALSSIPAIEPGDDLANIIIEALAQQALTLNNNDVLVLAQKIVSKAENRYAYLNDAKVSEEAIELAAKVNKDPRVVELIINESRELVRYRSGVLIVAHKKGYVHANAGIDQSNIDSDKDNPRVLLLPKDSDVSAQRLRQALKTLSGKPIHIIINDSAGRAWRNGTIGMAIGTAGFAPLQDCNGQDDLYGRALQATTVAVADELASAASFVMGQGAEGLPVVLIRGAKLSASDDNAQQLIRKKQDDLFR